jgi:hypothetical protein
MNEKTGEINLLDYENFVQNIDNYIDSNGLNLPSLSLSKDFEECLSFNNEELSKMKREEALNASYIVLQFISHIQAEYNKNMAINNWLESAITSLCQTIIQSKIIDTNNEDFKYLKSEAKRIVLLNCTEYGKQLSRLNENVKSRLTLLEGKVDVLKRISNVLHDKGRNYDR